MTCLQEHHSYYDDPHLGCFADREHFFMPPEYRKFLEPQSSVHNNNENNGDDKSDGDFMIGNMDGGEDDVGSGEDDVGSISSNDSLLTLL